MTRTTEQHSNHGSLCCDHDCFTVNSNLSISYDIKLKKEILSSENSDLADLCPSGRSLLIADKNVWEIYGEKVKNYFESHSISIEIVTVECGEESKTLETTLEILQRMEQFGVLRRSEPIIAIGGGVLLDIVGFASSMYRRGVPYIRIPTTLMGMIDATLGVKTGINYLERRNRLGAYYGPACGLVDTGFLASLNSREISNGVGEIFKMAIVKDHELFLSLEKNGKTLLESRFQGNSEVVDDMVNRSIKGMLDELVNNMWELDLKRLVDFGHSFSPLIEMKAMPLFLHGEAVALDVVLSCAISRVRGWLSDYELKRIIDVASNFSLPWTHPLFRDVELLQKALSDTILHRNGNQNLPIPIKIGESIFVNDVDRSEIKKATRLLESLIPQRMEMS